MSESDVDRSRKYTAIMIIVLASLLLFGLIGLVAILTTQSNNSLTLNTSSISMTPDSPELDATPARDEIVVTPTLEPLPTKPDVLTNSTQIIAPLLSFSESIESGETHNYLFQAVANTPLVIDFETTYDIHIQMLIVDRSDETVYEIELGRGLHEITFNPDVSSEYRIKIKAIQGKGGYTIGMAFAPNEEPQI